MTPATSFDAAPVTSRDSWQVRSAQRRRGCAVGLDLRVAGQAGAVAVDGKGQACAWALVFGDGSPEELSKLAIAKLVVKPTELRILLGSEEAQVGVFAGMDDPEADQITETMLAEGYAPIDRPAAAAIAAAPGTWLVAECDEDRLHALAEGYSDLLGIEPQCVIDQLLLAQSIDIGSAAVESGEVGLSIVTKPRDAAPYVRSLPATVDSGGGVREALRTLGVAGVEGSVSVLGSKAGEILPGLEQHGFEVVTNTMPTHGSDTMPASLELAWRLAAERTVPGLHGSRLDRRARGVLWARRTAWAALVLGLLGFALFAFGLTSWLTARERLRAFEAETAGMEAQMQQVRETVALAEEVRRLRAERAEQAFPWPRVARTLAGLARERPPHLGWERLAITEGALELVVSISDPASYHELIQMRQTLERSPGIVNLAWQAHEDDGQTAGRRHTFRASMRAAAPHLEEAMP